MSEAATAALGQRVFTLTPDGLRRLHAGVVVECPSDKGWPGWTAKHPEHRWVLRDDGGPPTPWPPDRLETVPDAARRRQMTR